MDSLYVSLGLDTAAFDKGVKNVDAELKRLREGVPKTTVDIQQTGKKTVETFSGMKIGVLEMAAALMGAIKLLEQFRGTAENLRAIGVASRNIGISVQDLTAFRNAVEANGGNADQASASFQHLADAMARFALTGKTELLPFLNEIGGNLGDNAMQTYMKFVEWASRQGGNMGRIRLIGQGLGLDEGSIQLALKGAAGVRRELDEARRRGLPTDEEVKNMTELSRAFRELDQAVETVWRRLANDFAPTLTAILATVKELIVQNPELAKGLGALGGALGVIAALKLPGWLLRGLGGGAAAAGAAGAGGGAVAAGGPAAGTAATGGGLSGWISRTLGASRSFFFVDADAARQMGDRIRRDYPGWRERQGQQAPGQDSGGGFWGGVKRFFGIGGANAAPTGGAVPRVSIGSTNSRMQQAHDYFISQGWSEAQVAGILGNLQHESGLNPGSFNPAGGGQGAMGIAQWRGDRIEQFRRLHGGRSPLEATYAEQLAFIQWELANSESAAGRALRSARTPEEASRVFEEQYERPGPDGTGPRRAGAANEFYKRFSPGALSGAGLGGNGLQASAGSSFSIGQVVVNTQARDAPGIARDIGAELRRTATIAQADRGLA